MKRKTIILAVMLLFIGAVLVPSIGSKNETSMEDVDWWNNDWLFRKQITIDHTKVDGDLTNFPVLVWNTSSDFATHAQPDGDDFVFTLGDIDQMRHETLLNHEIEYYDETIGEIIAWVNVPELSSTLDTKLYVYYGNPTAGNQQNPEDVWDSNYAGVWHMDDMTTSAIKDSTINNIIGTKKDVNEPVASTGKIARCQDFDGRVACDDFINCGHPSALDCTGYITVEMIVKLDSLPGGPPYVSNYCHLVRKDRCYTFYLIQPGTLKFYYWTSGGTRYWGESSFTLSTSTWYHVVATFTSNGNQVELFQNGVKNMPTESTQSEAQDNTVDMMVGGQEEDGHGGWTIDGRIDEFRISNIVRSDGWISTGYNNQINPETFMTFGEKETVPLKFSLLFGKIENLTTIGELTRFEASNLRYLQFLPFTTQKLTSGETIVISNSKLGVLTTNFAFGLFGAAI
jgi:MSHA biogenesis protein MshQ